MASSREEAKANFEWLQTAAWHVKASIPAHTVSAEEFQWIQARLERAEAAAKFWRMMLEHCSLSAEDADVVYGEGWA